MNRKGFQIIMRAQKDPSLLATEEYISAQMERSGLLALVLQMGPECNLSCSHCHGCYGRERKGRPKPSMIERTIEQAVEIGCLYATLTDGEPMMWRNKLAVGVAAKHSRELPIAIMTNANFARTDQNAEAWFNFLKDNGFDLESGENVVQVSAGQTYNVHWHNYVRLNFALKHAFPVSDFGKHLSYSFLGYGNLAREQSGMDRVLRSLSAVFNESKRKVTLVQDIR